MYLAHIHPGACAEGEEAPTTKKDTQSMEGTGMPLHKR
jgi:hypothetical protein